MLSDLNSSSLNETAPSGLPSELEVLECVGAGGSGNVFRARDLRLDRTVAVKIMHRHLINTENQERFKREKIFAGSLRHPGIVTTYYSGITGDGLPFIVMDYLHGSTLESCIKDGVEPARFYAIFDQIVEAIAYLHDNGVVHRDLKPSNVFLCLDSDGLEHAVLIDFGLCKSIQTSNQDATRTGSIVGTSLYMSPEQCTGGSVDHRSDIYALGCMLFEVFTGEPPFSGSTSYEVMFRQLNESISGNKALKRLPSDLSKLIARCLRKDPQERPQNVREVGEMLARCSLRPQRSRRFTIACFSIFLLFLAILSSRLHPQAAPLNWKVGHQESITSAALGFGAMRTLVSKDIKANQKEKAFERLSGWFRTVRIPPSEEAYTYGAETCLALQKFEMAATFARQTIACARTPQEMLNSRLLLARVYEAEHKFDASRQEVQSALRQAGDNVDGTRVRSSAIVHLWRLDEQEGKSENGLDKLKAECARMIAKDCWYHRYALDIRVALISSLYKCNHKTEARQLIDDTIKLIPAVTSTDNALCEFQRLVSCAQDAADAGPLAKIYQAVVASLGEPVEHQWKAFWLVASFHAGNKDAAIKRLRSLIASASRRDSLVTPRQLAEDKLALAGLLVIVHQVNEARDLLTQIIYDRNLSGSLTKTTALSDLFHVCGTDPAVADCALLDKLTKVDGSLLYQTMTALLRTELKLRQGLTDDALNAAQRCLELTNIVRASQEEVEIDGVNNFLGTVRLNCLTLKSQICELRCDFAGGLDSAIKALAYLGDTPADREARIGLFNAIYRNAVALGYFDKARRACDQALPYCNGLDPLWKATVLTQRACVTDGSECIRLLEQAKLCSEHSKNTAAAAQALQISWMLLQRRNDLSDEEVVAEVSSLLDNASKTKPAPYTEEAQLCALGLAHASSSAIPEWKARFFSLAACMGPFERSTLMAAEAERMFKLKRPQLGHDLYQAALGLPASTAKTKYAKTLVLRSYCSSLVTSGRLAEAEVWVAELLRECRKLEDNRCAADCLHFLAFKEEAHSPHAALSTYSKAADFYHLAGAETSRRHSLKRALKLAKECNDPQADSIAEKLELANREKLNNRSGGSVE